MLYAVLTCVAKPVSTVSQLSNNQNKTKTKTKKKNDNFFSYSIFSCHCHVHYMLALPDRIHKVETQDIEVVSTFTIILTALFMFRLLCICISKPRL